MPSASTRIDCEGVFRSAPSKQCRSPGLATGETRDRPVQAYAKIASMHSPQVHHNGRNKTSIRMLALSDTIDATSALGRNNFDERIYGDTVSKRQRSPFITDAGAPGLAERVPRVSPLARPGLRKAMRPDGESGHRKQVARVRPQAAPGALDLAPLGYFGLAFSRVRAVRLPGLRTSMLADAESGHR